MEKYKVCPVCGMHNNPLFLECTDCEADLQNVPITDESTEQAGQSGERASVGKEAPVSMVRICDCGAKNPVQARRCSACGEDISVIVPTPDTADNSSEAPKYLLTSLEGAFAYEIPAGSTVIGREQEMREYLSSKPFVSRKHAELILDTTEGKLFIRNYSTTNYTFVNNNMISGDKSVELKDGDEIGLGGYEQDGERQPEAAFFLVRIGACM